MKADIYIKKNYVKIFLTRVWQWQRCYVTTDEIPWRIFVTDHFILADDAMTVGRAPVSLNMKPQKNVYSHMM